MCNYDVYRGRTISEPKRPAKLHDLIKDDGEVELVAASARLVEAVGVLRK